MSKTTVAQLHKQAETLKAKIADASFGSNEAWVSRQSLQDIYQRSLVVDLEYSLDKKVEQDLWNHVFKNQINAMQSQAKDRQIAHNSVKKAELQASLNLFLETASGFYVQLLEELCCAFRLDLPFRKQSTFYGVIKEPTTAKGIKIPKKASALYIIQYALVHLGDISRYRQQIDQAQTYYRHAALLVPTNGQPYNQLAILEAAKGNKLSTVFYYVRSLAVKHPFPVAATNLEKFYLKASKESVNECNGKLSMNAIVAYYLHFHALIHLSLDLDSAKKLSDRIVNNLVVHINSASFNAYRLVQVICINIYALNRLREEKNIPEEERCTELMLNFTVSLLDQFLCNIPKQEQRAKDYHTLPAIKLLLDWITTNQHCLTKQTFKNSAIFFNLSRLLNNIQSPDAPKMDLGTYETWPLPEDLDIIGFQPLEEVNKTLDFSKKLSDVTTLDTENRLRCQRLMHHGKLICEQFQSVNLLNFTVLKSGKVQFRVPGTHIVKFNTGNENENEKTDKKPVRQNVAIQAILQNSKSDNMKPEEQKKVQTGKIQLAKSKLTKTGQPVRGHVQILSPPHSKNNQGNRSRHSSIESQPGDTIVVQSQSGSDLSQREQAIGRKTSTGRNINNNQSVNYRPTTGPSQSNISVPDASLASFPPLPSQNMANSSHNHGHTAATFPGLTSASGHNRLPQSSPQEMLGPPHMKNDMSPGSANSQVFPLFAQSNSQHISTSSPITNLQPDLGRIANFPPPSNVTANGLSMPVPQQPCGRFPYMYQPPPHHSQPSQIQTDITESSSKPGTRIEMDNLFQQMYCQPSPQNWQSLQMNVPASGFGIHNNQQASPQPRADYDPLKSLFSHPPPGHPLFTGFPPKTPPKQSENIDIWRPSTADLNLSIPTNNKAEQAVNDNPTSLFASNDRGTGIPSAGGTYSLFSHSPWNMPVQNTIDSKGFNSHQYGGPNIVTGPGPPVQLPPQFVQHEPSLFTSANMQSMWSSGPSPLEKLLEQQKHHRQNDPH